MRIEPSALLAFNASLQLVVSSLLGFLMLVPRQPWGKALAPHLDQKSLLSTHLDWNMLALMQFGAAFVMGRWAETSSVLAAWLLAAGGWLNAMPYILRGFGINAFVLAGSRKQLAAAGVSGLSATAVTAGWVMIAWTTGGRLLG